MLPFHHFKSFILCQSVKIFQLKNHVFSLLKMADSTKCFYEILGVSREAEEDEIQAAFEASKQVFEVSKQAFDASKTAFEVLNDPKKRGAYDRQKENKKISIFFSLNYY